MVGAVVTYLAQGRHPSVYRGFWLLSSIKRINTTLLIGPAAGIIIIFLTSRATTFGGS
jgi:hypothetical protein